MIIKQTRNIKDSAFPLQLQINFDKIFQFYQPYLKDENHPYNKSAKATIDRLNNYPELIDGFSDESLLEKYEGQINLILEPIFPEILTNNEIKAASIPFSFTTFKLSNRFKNIIQNAGDDYVFSIRNFHENELYIHGCVMILAYCYGYNIDLKRPFFFDVPDKNLGITKHYRVALNGDFASIIPVENTPKITDEDYKLLLDNYSNIEVWKEKFPPNSYIFKGFVIMNLFDVTPDENLASLTKSLLRLDDSLITDIGQNLREFFNINDLQIGFSIFDTVNIQSCDTRIKRSDSLILNGHSAVKCSEYFCNETVDKIFNKHETVTISDVEKYGKISNENNFYKDLKSMGLQSIILIPIKATDNNDLALLEIASPRPYELNSINQNKLRDIIPVFKAAIKRSSEDHQNILEATIQEHYTSIHPTVKWRFYEAAEKYFSDGSKGVEDRKLDEIVFQNVHPLYGQSDIRESSIARNTAIKNDLIVQLNLAVDVLNNACKVEKLPIYEELMFRVEKYLFDVKKGLHAGDEVAILDFFRTEIYPVFSHIKAINTTLKNSVDTYMDRLDPKLHVVYEQRKAYEESVTLLNQKLADYLDKKQEEAQAMFPHYFERYKTDGVEYNMYIGQSLVNNKEYNLVYLHNLRLWQLQVMCEMEWLARSLKSTLAYELEIASLILVHSSALAIQFRMDEKQFDVDGAYNIRYEIIKKRIDKGHIKGTSERLTEPGKIAIVYSQDKDAIEYEKYIKYLQSINYLGKVETLELEDLQDVSGLKALRVEVIYNQDFNQQNTITIDQLIEDIKTL